MWFNTHCKGCGWEVWRLASSATVVHGWLTESYCTHCGRRELFVVEDAEPEAPSEYGWLRTALVRAGLEKP